MPTFYNFNENGLTYRFDDIFVPADLFREGNLWVWGNGSSGILGINATTNSLTPVTTFSGGANWKQVSSSYFYAAAIKTDGTLWTWGYGGFGELGTNDAIQRNTPVTTFAGGTNWRQVSCAYQNISAIKTDGTLWVWGWALNGRLGDGRTSESVSTPITTFSGGANWKQVSSGGYHTAAIKTDGTLWVWGNGAYGRLGTNATINRSTPITTFSGGANWKQVSSSFNGTSAVKTDGTLWVWGNNFSGQLGRNDNATMSIPTTTFAGGTDWKQVSSGSIHTAAIKTDGTLWTWGGGANGPLGNNDTTNRSTPVTTFTGGTDWKQVSSGGYHTAAVKTDGTLWTWGNNLNGQLGNNSTVTAPTPITTFYGGTNWRQVDPGLKNTLSLTYDDPVI